MSISIDIADMSYVLDGDTNLILNRRRVKSNFESIGSCFDSSDKVIVRFSTADNPNEFESQENQYKSIVRLLDKYGIDYSKTTKAQEFSLHIDSENESFKKFSLKAKNIRNKIHDGEEFKRFSYVVECKLTRELYTLQLLSAYHLAFAQNACNFSVPGAGKTSVVYAAYAYLKNLPIDDIKHVDRLLIISPLAAFAPWKDEYQGCFDSQTSVKELVGLSRADRQSHFYSDRYTEITLISYQSASSDADVEDIIAYLKRYHVMVVLDEAHKIKNVDGGRCATAILSFAKYARARVVLTGTPAPYGYQDLYNLYNFIWPDKNIIGFPVHYLQRMSEDYSPKSLSDIQNLIGNISPFFMRIKKSDFRDFPEAIYHEPIIVPMSQNQRAIYSHIEKKYIDYFEHDDSDTSFTGKLKKAKLIRLMQCITNPHLLNKSLNAYLDDEGLSHDLNIDDRVIVDLIQSFNPQKETPPKFSKALELVKKITNNKGADGRVIIWAIFVQNMLDLKEFFNARGVECELLYGDTPNENENTPADVLTREKIIKAFHSDDCGYKVIIANPFAVGESISLHHACHNAIYLEKNFNAAMYMQSKDRVHRYGLDKDAEINYYFLISEDSIDETIHSRVLEKETRMLEIIESDEIPLLNMNMDEENDSDEDIKAIIRNYHARKSS
jgi:SNF2 family DNA or RNA helicase